MSAAIIGGRFTDADAWEFLSRADGAMTPARTTYLIKILKAGYPDVQEAMKLDARHDRRRHATFRTSSENLCIIGSVDTVRAAPGAR